jgi:hypothetical protein
MDEMMLNTPMRISDAASMLRRQVGRNERPLDKEVIQLNNALVDEWYANVLKGLADTSGSVPAGRVSSCFNYFLQGKELTRHQKFKDHLLDIPEAKVLFWIEFFRKASMTEIYAVGPGVVSAAWSMITTAIRYHFAGLKWKMVYSLSRDPLQWDRLANDNPGVMNGRPLPFGLTYEILKDIEEKVSTLLQHPIEPR